MITVTISVPEPVWLQLRRLAEENRINCRGRASVSGLVNRWLLERVAQEPFSETLLMERVPR